MAAQKSKTFKSNADGTITVTLGSGHGVRRLAPGDTYETDNAVEIAALEANSDISEAKFYGKSKK